MIKLAYCIAQDGWNTPTVNSFFLTVFSASTLAGAAFFFVDRQSRWLVTEYLSYDFITSNIALSEWFKKSAEFWAEIERSEPLITTLEIPLEEANEEGVDGGDDEDVPMEPSTLIVTAIVDDKSLPMG